MALAAILPLRNALKQPASPTAGRSRLGGATGLGSQLYGLVRIAELLDDDELLDCARRIVDWFLPQRISRDNSFDVIDGTAGGILGLLAVSEAGANFEGTKMLSGGFRGLRTPRQSFGHWCSQDMHCGRTGLYREGATWGNSAAGERNESLP